MDIEVKVKKRKNVIIETLGWLGAFSLLFGYFLIQTKRVQHDYMWYLVLNIVGAFFLMLNTWYHGAYPSMVANLVWTVIGLYAVYQIYYRSQD